MLVPTSNIGFAYRAEVQDKEDVLASELDPRLLHGGAKSTLLISAQFPKSLDLGSTSSMTVMRVHA